MILFGHVYFALISQGILLEVIVTPNEDGFGGLVVSMLVSGTRVRGFKPWKILRMPSFGGEVKESVPCPSFAAF